MHVVAVSMIFLVQSRRKQTTGRGTPNEYLLEKVVSEDASQDEAQMQGQEA